MALGIRGVNPRRGDFITHLQTLRTGDGAPIPPHTQQALTREYERLRLIERQIREIEAAQAAAIKAAAGTPARPEDRSEGSTGRAALLTRLKDLGPIDAVVLSREVFYRHFDNRREVASYFGLTPSSHNSRGMRSDQGIGKAGNSRARALAIELAWPWVRHQPESALTHWFLERVGTTTGRIRRIAIVA